MNDELQKRAASLMKEKGKYGIAVAVIAAMLFAVGFPGYVLVFLGVTSFFVWKAFAPTRSSSVRGIFEFYLAANEMLKDDEKRWFGFEMQEVLHSGEKILNTMPDPPPLMLFTLGALHNKIGNYELAVRLLGSVIENDEMDEGRRVIASAELKNYVRVLRRIEREPGEAPQTSAAIRALERARRNRAVTLLEDSRKKLIAQKEANAQQLAENREDDVPVLDLTTSVVDAGTYTDPWNEPVQNGGKKTSLHSPLSDVFKEESPTSSRTEPTPQTNDRKPISEVLKDIYGR